MGDKASVGGVSSTPLGSVKKAGNGAGLNSSIESPKSQGILTHSISASLESLSKVAWYRWHFPVFAHKLFSSTDAETVCRIDKDAGSS